MSDPKPLKRENDPQRAQDAIFANPRGQIDDFDFGAETAAVFDDMLQRSVPYYAEVQRIIGELVARFATDGSNIYDMGCSTATTIQHIAPLIPPAVTARFVGIDSSPEMLDRARQKLDGSGIRHPVELRCADLNQPIQVENASAVLFVLTLQFVRPLHRERLMRSVCEGMNKGGCLVLLEKIVGEDSKLNRLFIEHY
jgi:tRNA (cmo5U34)-methyltransferase